MQPFGNFSPKINKKTDGGTLAREQEPKEKTCPVQSVFLKPKRTFAKFRPKNTISTYTKDFFSHGKKTKDPNSPEFEEFFFSKLPDFYGKFQKVTNNIEGFCILSTFISNMQPKLAKIIKLWMITTFWLHHKILKRPCHSTPGVGCLWVLAGSLQPKFRGKYIIISFEGALRKKLLDPDVAGGP